MEIVFKNEHSQDQNVTFDCFNKVGGSVEGKKAQWNKKALMWRDNKELVSISNCAESQEWQKCLHKFLFIYSFMSIFISVLDFKMWMLNLEN